MIIKNKKLKGSIVPPPSKSIAHRALICAALAKGKSVISNIDMSDDIIATSSAIASMGAEIEILKAERKIIVDGTKMFENDEFEIDCNESGSTARFFIPLAVAKKSTARLVGRGKLGTRPMTPFYDAFDKDGIKYENNSDESHLLFELSGELKGGDYNLRGDVSSQFLTGLLFALSVKDIDSTIHITTEMESKGYVDLTISAMASFGVEVENKNYKTFKIKGGQKYTPRDYTVESDFSQAAFFLCGAAMGNDIEVKNMNINSGQGDKLILQYLEKLGYIVLSGEDSIKVSVSGNEQGTVIDGSECPDIIPILSVLAALTKGKTEIINSQRLRIKECDRIKAMYENLKILGADIIETEDGLIIEGVEEFSGGEVSSFDDHRIAMCMAIASSRCKSPIKLKNPYCVSKSYPHFFEDFQMLGGEIDER